MKTFAIMKTETFNLKEGTKTVFVSESVEEKAITEKEYNNIIDSSPFFRRLGGSEHHTKCYTSKGYKTYQLSSKNPSRDVKVVRTFDLDI